MLITKNQLRQIIRQEVLFGLKRVEEIRRRQEVLFGLKRVEEIRRHSSSMIPIVDPMNNTDDFIDNAVANVDNDTTMKRGYYLKLNNVSGIASSFNNRVADVLSFIKTLINDEFQDITCDDVVNDVLTIYGTEDRLEEFVDILEDEINADKHALYNLDYDIKSV